MLPPLQLGPPFELGLSPSPAVLKYFAPSLIPIVSLTPFTIYSALRPLQSTRKRLPLNFQPNLFLLKPHGLSRRLPSDLSPLRNRPGLVSTIPSPRLLCCLVSSSRRLCLYFVSSSPVSTRQGHRPLSPCVLYCDRIQTLDNRGCCAVDCCCVPSLVIVLPCVVLFSSILYNPPTRRCAIHRHKSAIHTHPPPTLDVRHGAARKYLYIKQKETGKKSPSPLLSYELAVYLHHHG